MKTTDRGGEKVLPYLLGPDTFPTNGSEGGDRGGNGKRENKVSDHLEHLVERELWEIRRLLRIVAARQQCPASERPRGRCSDEGCQAHVRQQPPQAFVAELDRLRQSPFLGGARPHLHEVYDAVLARLRRVFDLYALHESRA